MAIGQKYPIRVIFGLVAVLAVFYPLFVWFRGLDLPAGTVTLPDIFPAFGLVAFSVMWLHIIGAPFRNSLEIYFDFGKFVSVTSKVVLASLILHPLLALIVLLSMDHPVFIFDLAGPGRAYLVWFALVAWLIFIGYDIAKPFRERDFFARHWQTIKLASTLAFFLALVHSLGLGRDLQSGALRYVWIGYGLAAAIAAFYTYIWPRKAT